MGVTNLSCLESKKVSVIYHLSIYLPIIPPSIYFSFFLSSYLNYLFISLSSINIYHISICIFYHLSISHPSTYLPISLSTSSITYLLSIYYLCHLYVHLHAYISQTKKLPCDFWLHAQLGYSPILDVVLDVVSYVTLDKSPNISGPFCFHFCFYSIKWKA